MARPLAKSAPHRWSGDTPQATVLRQRMRWRIVAVLLFVALAPLLLLSIGSTTVFRSILVERSLKFHAQLVASQALIVDNYLDDLTRALQLSAHGILASSNDADIPINTMLAFEALAQSHPHAFSDLGVIDAGGKHRAYVGPYDLLGANYDGTEWFQMVRNQGRFVSDVFLGYRKVPHCIVAVRYSTDRGSFFLRATINIEHINELLRIPVLDTRGDLYIIDRNGRFQSTPSRGHIFDPSTIDAPAFHHGFQSHLVDQPQNPFVRATTWINNGRWMLVAEHAQKDILAPLNAVLFKGTLVLATAILLAVLTIFLATWHLCDRLERVQRERDGLTHDLLRSARLASIGELATGLAHEINNPLAIISAEHTNIGDIVAEIAPAQAAEIEIKQSLSRCQRQVARCANITTKMLQFAHNSEQKRQLCELAPLINECVELLKRQASTRQIEIALDVEASLSRVFIDGNEFEQVLVNLMNNALQALTGQGRIAISAHNDDDDVRVVVEDNGRGIAPEHLEHVFEPFFTTKPVGQGTGLGLAVCYGFVRGWGGSIDISSKLGYGTCVTMHIPYLQKNSRNSIHAQTQPNTGAVGGGDV